VTNCLEAESKSEKPENFYLFEYCLYFRWLLEEIHSGAMRSLLLAAVPYSPISNLLVHPLVFPLAFAYKNKANPPKILFLNLDGRETVSNLRALKLLPESVRYISVFEEPGGSDLLRYCKMEA
jgi:hypothetical protein